MPTIAIIINPIQKRTANAVSLYFRCVAPDS